MRKHLIVLVLFMTFLAGCHQEQQNNKPTLEGYIMRIEKNEMLVVSGITKEQAVRMSWKELNEEAGLDYKAQIFQENRWFHDLSKQYRKGQKVRVWGKGGANESDPLQSELQDVEVIQ